MTAKVKVVEVGPRDGFQNVKEYIPAETKLEIIDGLVNAGLQKIEITSFVSPKAIPQMQDAAQIAETSVARYPDIELFALVPNLFGAKAAVAAGLKEITPVISLSASHNMANIRRTHEQSIEDLAKIRQELPDVKINLDIATAFGCPFEEEMPVDQLIEFIGKLRELGINAFTLCDTIGIAYPTLVEEVFQRVRKEFPQDEFNAHIHDTRNMGILNSYVAMLNGADSVQTSLGGLGGCPFAPGASGNTSTEDLVYMLNKSGFDTGIDFDKLLATAKLAKEKIDGNFSGHHIHISKTPCI